MILISSFKMTKSTSPTTRMTTSSLMLRIMIICSYSLKKKKNLKILSPFTRQSLNLNKKEIWTHLCWKLKDDKQRTICK